MPKVKMTKSGARGFLLVFGVISLIMGFSTDDSTGILVGAICSGVFILSILIDKNPNW